MLPNASYISFILWVLINIGHIEDWIGMVIIRVLFCSDGYSLVFVKIAYELVFNAAKSLALLRHPSHTGAPFLSEGGEKREGERRAKEGGEVTEVLQQCHKVVQGLVSIGLRRTR